MLGWFSIFMDDGVIHTKQKPDETEEQHIQRHRKYVHEIFDTLAKNDLYVKPEKCAFEQEEIEYLGVIVGKGRLRMDPVMAAYKYFRLPVMCTQVTCTVTCFITWSVT